MCTATSRGPQLQNLENLYRCEEPQKEEFREFDIYFLIENNYYQQMHYTKSVKTLWNTTCVFLFFTKPQVSIIQNKPEDHWSCIAHLIAEDMLKSAIIEEKKCKNIECK